jgi:PIN domain nuclease of toxin-antitoxin system
MRLLLDTHALLWFCEGNASLSAAAREAMEDRANERFVSHASAWEVAIKLALGKLNLLVPYEDIFPGVLIPNGFAMLPADLAHYRSLLQLPLHHRDPFDRLLIAQAQAEKLTLVSRDASLAAYGVPVLCVSGFATQPHRASPCGRSSSSRSCSASSSAPGGQSPPTTARCRSGCCTRRSTRSRACLAAA